MTVQRLVAAILLSAAAVGAATVGFARLPVAAAASMMGLAVARRPELAFAAIPMAVPAIDLTPWSGRYFFNETDVWLLTAIGASLWSSDLSHKRVVRPIDRTLFLSIVISYALSAGVALQSGLGSDAGNAYCQPLNVFRVGKPILYLAPLWFILLRSPAPAFQAFTLFVRGVAVGLALTAGQVAWERHRFCGAFDTESEFRASGPFSEMHVGGAYLDAYLVLSIPLVACAWMGSSYRRPRAAFGVVLLLGLYATLATLSRAPVLIVGAQLLLIGVFGQSVTFPPRFSRFTRLAVGATAFTVGALGISTIPAIRDRFDTLAVDYERRADHWKRSVAMLGDDWRTWLLGRGCGSYANAFRQHETAVAPGDYRLMGTAGLRYVRLTGNEPIYFSQFIRSAPDSEYILAVQARRMSEHGSLAVALCEKSALASYETIGYGDLYVDTPEGKWTIWSSRLNSRHIGKPIERSPLPPVGRPVALCFWASPGSVIDLASIDLLDRNGTSLVANPNFQSGLDRWWWTSDAHLSWHAHNLYLHLLIEQGLVGLFSFLAVAGRSLWLLTVRARRGSIRALLLACSIGGFLAIGAIDSLIDAPRIALVFYLIILFVAALHVDGAARNSAAAFRLANS